MCEEKLRLTQEYHAANKTFGDAVNALAKKTGTTSKEEYERLRQRSEELRLDSESAQLYEATVLAMAEFRRCRAHTPSLAALLSKTRRLFSSTLHWVRLFDARI